MTDAREIIAEKIQEFRDPSPDSYISGVTYSFADDLMDALTAAGFRILGPDEVDPVTLEKCVEVADQIAPESMEWNSYAAWVQRVANAIRAPGRKA